MRRITAYWWKECEKIRIGELAQGKNTPIVFEWDNDFLRSEIELSPLNFLKLPGLIECPREPFNGLPGLFADQVPDGWGRILLRRGLQRQGIGIQDISPLDMLQYIGEKGMGALSFEPSLKVGEKWAEGEVDLDELESGIEPILSGTASDVLDEFLVGGASPTGARPKIILQEKEGKFYLSEGEVAKTEWIIKFQAPEDSKHVGKLEYVYSQLAKKAGLRVPETKLFISKRGHFFGTKRFDRKENGGRIHMHSLSGILGTRPDNFSVGYEDFAKVASYLTKSAKELEQVFKIAVFNIFSCNQDDHCRNVSFLMDAKGKWTVAPAYDLTFFKTCYAEHSMSLGGKGRPTVEDINKFGAQLGFSNIKIKSIVDQIKDSLRNFGKLAIKNGVPSSEIKIVEEAFPRDIVSVRRAYR